MICLLVLYLFKQKQTQMRKLVQLVLCNVNHRHMHAAGKVPTAMLQSMDLMRFLTSHLLRGVSKTRVKS